MDYLDISKPLGRDRPAQKSFEGSPVAALDRFLAQLIREAWLNLPWKHGPSSPMPDFSGILPFPDPGLLPFLDRPGVFILFGPDPKIPVLRVCESRGLMGPALLPHLAPQEGSGPGGARSRGGVTKPAYAACIAMEDEWRMVPDMRRLLASRLQPRRPLSGCDGRMEPLI